MLRSIEIVLKGDTVCDFLGEWIVDEFVTKPDSINKREIRAYGPRKKSVIDKIRKHLFNVYGSPRTSTDSLENEYSNLLKTGASSKKFGMLKSSNYIDAHNMYVNFVDTWNLESVIIQMYREPYYYDSCFKDTMYPNAHIVYKMIGYENRFERIQRKIKSGFGPNDMMSIEFKQPSIQHVDTDIYGKVYELYQPFVKLSRRGPEDKRLVTDIKFDIIYLNRFNEEVARIQNCIYSFKEGIGPGKAKMAIGYKGSSPGYKIIYNSNNPNYSGYEYIRENIDTFNWKGKGKIVSEIKKVVFEDGTVLE